MNKDEDSDEEEEKTISEFIKEAVVMLEKEYTAYERRNSTHENEMRLINFRSLIFPGRQVVVEKS